MKVKRICTRLKTNHGQTMEINYVGQNGISLMIKDSVTNSTQTALLFGDEIETLINLIRETATGELE